MSGENVFENETVFHILKRLKLSNPGSYSVQLELKDDIDKEKAANLLEHLQEEGLVEEVEGTEPQLYDIRYEGFVERWFDYWNDIVEEDIVTPRNFDQFIQNYCKSYIEREGKSNIKEMLVKEFFVSLSYALEKNDLPSTYEELAHLLRESYEGDKSKTEHIHEALDETHE